MGKSNWSRRHLLDEALKDKVQAAAYTNKAAVVLRPDAVKLEESKEHLGVITPPFFERVVFDYPHVVHLLANSLRPPNLTAECFVQGVGRAQDHRSGQIFDDSATISGRSGRIICWRRGFLRPNDGGRSRGFELPYICLCALRMFGITWYRPTSVENWVQFNLASSRMSGPRTCTVHLRCLVLKCRTGHKYTSIDVEMLSTQ